MNDQTQIAKPFDSAALAGQLRDKIRADLAELMPPDVWKGFLKNEIDLFFEPKKLTDYHGRPTGKTEPSAFHTIVESIMREETRRHLHEMLSSPEWQGFWEGNKQIASVKVKELIKEAAPDIVASVLGNLVQQAVENMQYTLQHR